MNLEARIWKQIHIEEKATRKRDKRADALRKEGRYMDAARTQANADNHRGRARLLHELMAEES